MEKQLEKIVSLLRVLVLKWASILAGFVLWMMNKYLTTVWGLNYTHAAAIVNFFSGLGEIMPLTMQFLVDAFMGRYWMLLLSSLFYIVGLFFLSMSTPSVLSRATGTCGEYKPECIGKEQKILFYTGLVVLSVIALPGHKTSLADLIEDKKEKATLNKVGKFFLLFFPMFLLNIIGLVGLNFIKSWSYRYALPTIFMTVAVIIFLTGSRSSYHKKPEGSPLSTVCRVFVASASKMFHSYPKDIPSQQYDIINEEEASHNHRRKPHTNHLRFLDKATVLIPDQSLEQQKKNRWRLCSVTEVEETKRFVCMIPICLTFIMLGLVSSVGKTYFLEQGNNMNRKVRQFKIPLIVLRIAQNLSASLFGKMIELLNRVRMLRRFAALIGIAVSMILAILCCITAAKVETRRLDAVKDLGLLDNPDAKISMSIFWLLPQIFLLGGFKGLSNKSIDSFFKKQVSIHMKQYMVYFSHGVIGVGTVSSVFLVYLLDKITAKGNNPSWFQDTLNRSRLDNYYWLLSVLSAVNLVVYILLVIWYGHEGIITEEMESEKEELELTPEEMQVPEDDETTERRLLQRAGSTRLRAPGKSFK